MLTTDLIKHATGEYDLEIVSHLKLTSLVRHHTFYVPGYSQILLPQLPCPYTSKRETRE